MNNTLTKKIDGLKDTLRDLTASEIKLTDLIDRMESEKARLEYVIALGHNWDRREGELSLPSKITAITAYLLWRLGLTEKVIFSGGITAGGGGKSEAQTMQDYVRSVVFRNVDPSGINTVDVLHKFDDARILENESFDTRSNALGIAKLIRQDVDDAITGGSALLSIGYHTRTRALSIFRNNGLTEVEFGLDSEILLAKIMGYLRMYPDKLPEYKSIYAELKFLLEDYYYFLRTPVQVASDGKTVLRKHGPEYHLMAKIYQIVTNDPTGEKLSEKAEEMRNTRSS